MAVQGDGKSVVVGSSNFGGSHTSDFAPARYHPNSSLDTSFAGDGRQTTDFGGSNGANGVAIQGGGKLQPLRLRRVGLLVLKFLDQTRDPSGELPEKKLGALGMGRILHPPHGHLPRLLPVGDFNHVEHGECEGRCGVGISRPHFTHRAMSRSSTSPIGRSQRHGWRRSAAFPFLVFPRVVGDSPLARICGGCIVWPFARWGGQGCTVSSVHSLAAWRHPRLA